MDVDLQLPIGRVGECSGAMWVGARAGLVVRVESMRLVQCLIKSLSNPNSGSRASQYLFYRSEPTERCWKLENWSYVWFESVSIDVSLVPAPPDVDLLIC